MLDHLRRAHRVHARRCGRSTACRCLGFADWNDTVNLRTGAESLFTANLYGKALLEMIDLSRHLGDAASAEQYAAYYAEMKQRVNQCAWDGEWYVRYFDFDGTPLGSHDERQRADLHQRSIVAGHLRLCHARTRARQAWTRCERELNTRNGIKLSAPGFNGFDPKCGGITTYPPGAKENGGIFLHTNPWVIIAETMMGNGDRAFEYYAQINPAAKNDSIDEYECEPYVYAQNILGDEHPQFGLARNSWLSGTASWTYQAGTQYILGVRPTYDGLMIDPCIPHAWDGFQCDARVPRRGVSHRRREPGSRLQGRQVSSGGWQSHQGQRPSDFRWGNASSACRDGQYADGNVEAVSAHKSAG